MIKPDFNLYRQEGYVAVVDLSDYDYHQPKQLTLNIKSDGVNKTVPFYCNKMNIYETEDFKTYEFNLLGVSKFI